MRDGQCHQQKPYLQQSFLIGAARYIFRRMFLDIRSPIAAHLISGWFASVHWFSTGRQRHGPEPRALEDGLDIRDAAPLCTLPQVRMSSESWDPLVRLIWGNGGNGEWGE